MSVCFTITGCAQAGHPHWRAPSSRKPLLPPRPMAPRCHPARLPSTESSHRHPDNLGLEQSLTPAGTSRRKKRSRKRKRNGERDCLVERRHGGRRAQSRACSGRGVWAGGPGDGRASGAWTRRTNDAQGGASTQTGASVQQGPLLLLTAHHVYWEPPQELLGDKPLTAHFLECSKHGTCQSFPRGLRPPCRASQRGGSRAWTLCPRRAGCHQQSVMGCPGQTGEGHLAVNDMRSPELLSHRRLLNK